VTQPTARSQAAALLGGPNIGVWPHIDVELLERMIAVLGQGPDHLEGEEIAALVVERNTQSAIEWINPIRAGVHAALAPKYDFGKGALLTDTQIILRDVTERVGIPYDQIQSATQPGGLEGMVLDYLKLATPAGTEKYTCGSHGQLAVLLTDLSAHARAGRLTLDRMAAPAPRGADVSGAQTFSTARRLNDERAAFLLKGVVFQHQAGHIDAEAALDLTRRIALLHRTTTGGRGSHQGMWISPLRPGELTGFFESRYGAPTPQTPLHGFDTILYTRNEAHAAGAPGARISLRVKGKSSQWLAEKKLRLRLKEMTHPQAGNYTAYLVEAQNWSDWESLTGVHDAQLYNLQLELLAFEAQVILRRLLLGPDTDPATLLGVPDSTVDAKLADVNAAVDGSAFRVPRPFATVSQIAAPAQAAAGAPVYTPGGRPPLDPAPGAVKAVVWVNVVAGILALVVCSCVWCVMASSWQHPLETYILAPLGDYIDIERTKRAYSGIVVGQTGMQWVLGAVRIVLGGMAAKRGARRLGLALVALGGASLLAGDGAGVLASLVTAWCITRPSAKAWMAS
jgi:hypothetical protein